VGALPKRKVTKAAKAKRRSHHHLKLPQLINCPQCRQPRLSHHVCPNCGTYRGRQVLQLKEKSPAAQ
jgi:large subunit ribosomal protein L32